MSGNIYTRAHQPLLRNGLIGASTEGIRKMNGQVGCANRFRQD